MFPTSPAWGIGLATVTTQGQVLDTWFPQGRLGLGDAPAEAPTLPAGLVGPRTLPGLETIQVRVEIGALADPIRTPRTRTCGCTCCRRGWSGPNDQPRRHLRHAANNAWTSPGPGARRTSSGCG